jgi:hypothetical protein
MAKVVIDANILISPAFGGKPLDVVIKAMGRHDVYVSREIEQELKGVFSKLSGKLTGERLPSSGEDRYSSGRQPRKRIGTHHPIEGREGRPLPLIMQGGRSRIPHNRVRTAGYPDGLLEKKGIKTRIVNPHQFLEEEIP